MCAAPPVSRNLTSIYLRYRHERRGSKARGLTSEPQPGQLLLACDPDPRVGGGLGGDVEMGSVPSLPPQWVEAAEEAREDIKGVRTALVQLTKAQHKRLLKVFNDDAAPDREVEAITSQISKLLHKCESQIHQVKPRRGVGASDKDNEFRQNMQRNLATQLQHLSQQFRQAQKDYMSEINKRQQGGSLWDDVPEVRGGRGADVGFSDVQLQELEGMETNATQRSAEIDQIASSISDLNTIFKELAVLVIDQGSILDRIDYNIEQVVVQSKEANVQLQKAEKSQKSNRAMKCIFLLVAINAILILILIVKARH